ncbi:hypothetical protein MNBD_NITROSPINAE01-1157 [hydrothermal vent metagenome]|uniref:Uncharacterized protein n=1 Tax=hydrothermal vent metagenome TaxID=652676 RepID=A0A3B1BYF7_9ZZZZ
MPYNINFPVNRHVSETNAGRLSKKASPSGLTTFKNYGILSKIKGLDALKVIWKETEKQNELLTSIYR